MTKASITKKKIGDQEDLSYCFKPDCQHPENFGGALNCQSCGAPLLLKNRYRAIKIIAKAEKQKTFKAIDAGDSCPCYCTIQQFLVPVNQAERIAKLFEIEAGILQDKLEKLNELQQAPKLLEYFIEDGYPYLISEYIESHNINQELAAYGVFKESEVRELLLELLPILKVIHRQGIVHQNLKPEHIIRQKSEQKLILTNFGLDSIDNCSSYSAPEQIKGKVIYANDIYSLGIVCIRLLTQAHPKKVLSNRKNILNWRDYLDYREQIGESLGKTIDRMVQTSLERRYQSVEEVLKDLKPAINPLLIIRPSSVKAAIMVIITLMTAPYLFISERVSINQPNLISYRNYANSISEPKSAKYPIESGRLLSIIDGKHQALPLKNTKIEARISGNIAITEIKHTFSNPYDRPIEAVYQFVAKEKMKINGMEIKIGDRSFEGKIKKRADAIEIYDRTKNQIKTIALLQKDKNQLVTKSINNILPEESLEIKLRYSNNIEIKNGKYQYSFPMAILPQEKLDRTSENPLLEQRESNLEMTVEIDGGMSIYAVNSSTHKIEVLHTNSGVKVELTPEKNLSDRDFILNYKLSSSPNSTKFLTETNSKGSYFHVHLTPTKKYNNNQIISKDIVFLIDTSASQSRYQIERYRELMQNFIKQLAPEDTFTIIDSTNMKDKLNDQPLKNTPENQKNALDYISQLRAKGKTKLSEDIDRVLNLSNPLESHLRSIIIISDGSSSDSKKILDRVQKNLKPEHRFSTFGVGSSSDRLLIEGLARVGRGSATIISPEAKLSEIVEQFLAKINDRVLTNIKVSWIGSGKKPEIYPLEIPDLLADRPLVLYGHKSDRISGKLKITGILPEGEKYEEKIDINFVENQEDNVFDRFAQLIPQYWGFAKIKDLSNPKLKNSLETLRDTAIKYQILSEDTAFITVREDLK